MESDLHYFADRYFWMLVYFIAFLILGAIVGCVQLWERKRNEHKGNRRIS